MKKKIKKYIIKIIYLIYYLMKEKGYKNVFKLINDKDEEEEIEDDIDLQNFRFYWWKYKRKSENDIEEHFIEKHENKFNNSKFSKETKWKDAVDDFLNTKNDDFEDFDNIFAGKKGKMRLEDLLGEILGMDIGDKKKKKNKYFSVECIFMYN